MHACINAQMLIQTHMYPMANGEHAKGDKSDLIRSHLLPVPVSGRERNDDMIHTRIHHNIPIPITK
jgi:hypothetical protein